MKRVRMSSARAVEVFGGAAGSRRLKTAAVGATVAHSPIAGRREGLADPRAENGLMKRMWPVNCCLLAVLVVVPVGDGAAAEGRALPHRSWQFHDPDWDYLQQAIPKAKAAGMNRIQLSHQIVMDAEQLWAGDGYERRLDLVRRAAGLAHENGLKVDMWTHELSGLPKDRFRDAATGEPKLTPELWQWVEEKYEHLFTLVPELDGVVLTFAETDHKVYRDGVVSDEPPPQRVARLIQVMAEETTPSR